MKRMFFLFFPCFYLCFMGASLAQSFSFGGKVGLNMDKIAGNSFNSNYSASFQAGGFASLKVYSRWGLLLDVLYDQASNNVNTGSFEAIYVNENTIGEATSISRGLLSVPLLISYKVNNLVSLNAGPQVSALLYTNENLFRNGKAAFAKSDVAFCGGVRLDLKGVFIYTNYNQGLNNINNYDGHDEWKNSQINVGVEVPLVKL